MANLLGFKIFNHVKDNENLLIEKIFSKDKVHIISGNPEVLFNALYNKNLNKIIAAPESIIIPDGIGVVKLLNRSSNIFVDRLPGIELFVDLLEQLNILNESIYLIGSTDDVVTSLIKILNSKYINLKIVGAHHGYFDINNCEQIINDMRIKKPFAIFVAMGSPKQESFIAKYMDKLPSKIFMGLGGSFDIISENKKRAPNWFIKYNLEWFFRIMKEPVRLKKFYKSIIFILIAFFKTNKFN
ncbi:MAG: WecB/TagA/CpsF family glycosyltransferase [Sarcina sp.]